MISSKSKVKSINDRDQQRKAELMDETGDEDLRIPFSLARRSTTHLIQTVTIKYPQWHNAVAGGVAGAGSRLFTAPLDLVRIRAQLERRDVYPRPSILTRMINVYKAEGGITALFRGNLAASYLWVGYSTVQFSVYGTIKERLEDYRYEIAREQAMKTIQQQQLSQIDNLWTNPTTIAFLSGAGAGICATIATYPFDIARTVFASRGALQQNKKSKGFRPPTTIKECAISIYRQLGFVGFYAGSAPAVVQIIPYMGLNFVIYEFLITEGESSRASKSVGLSGYAGSISGAVSKIIVYPMDTIKKRIQFQSVFGAPCKTGVVYDGMWDCFATTIRTEGVFGLYRGLVPSVLKTTLGSGLAFTFFRSTKNLLESIHDHS